jgi:hypothetical protein
MAATSCVKERGYPEIGADIPFFKKILIFPEKDTDLFGKRY